MTDLKSEGSDFILERALTSRISWCSPFDAAVMRSPFATSPSTTFSKQITPLRMKCIHLVFKCRTVIKFRTVTTPGSPRAGKADTPYPSHCMPSRSCDIAEPFLLPILRAKNAVEIEIVIEDACSLGSETDWRRHLYSSWTASKSSIRSFPLSAP